ncbi:MAG: hypothetical protein KKF33_20410, partial [Alphaproteobacteria bacterium]|nr:hypothetical protein [Alphaproteobacteria bacterium]
YGSCSIKGYTSRGNLDRFSCKTNMMAKQSIIVKKKKGMTRKDAEKIARKYADRIYTARETSTSFRFRQRPPSDFKQGSFRTKNINSQVSIVYGELKK